MDDDDRELLRYLFAVATEIAESVHDTAAEGQSIHLAAQDYADLASRLSTATRHVSTKQCFLCEGSPVLSARILPRITGVSGGGIR